MAKKDKRRRRFGTVVKRTKSSGRVYWYARWREVRGGKPTERAFLTKGEASDFLDKIEKQIRAGTYATPRTLREAEAEEAEQGHELPTFVAYAKSVLDSRIAPTRAKATADLYRSNLAALTAYFGDREVEGVRIPAKRLEQITPAAFLDYRAWRRTFRRSTHGPQKPIGPVTMNRDHAFACLVLNMAVADGLLAENPLAGLRKLREPRQPRRYLTKSEASRLILACEPLFRACVVTELFTGLRPVELRNLRWADVSFESGKLAVFRAKVGNADHLDLHPMAADELRRLRASRPGARPDDHVFLNRNGRPWKDMRKAWRRAVKAAGLEGREGLTLYSLRHTFATHFLANGGAITDLRAQLGHSQLATTQIYADMVNERRRDTVLGLDYGRACGGTRSRKMSDQIGDPAADRGTQSRRAAGDA